MLHLNSWYVLPYGIINDDDDDDDDGCLLGCVKLLSNKVWFSYLLQQYIQKWTRSVNNFKNLVDDCTEWGI